MGSSQFPFRKSLLASSVAASCFVTPIVASAQAPVEEEVIVSGIRASLERSLDVKRNESGVVDAISAEDIGKFPDTNLAESMQRITGVSISRNNGEGSEVTVRGLGPSFNLVTLNGRQMPTASFINGANGASVGSSTNRAFDFATIASESVSGIEVYKTGRADVASGGMGATVNIKTARPFDNPGLNFTVGAKAVMDTTNEVNDDITPELSGLVSWTDDNEMFGVLVGASSQVRHSSQAFAYVTQWNTGQYNDGADGNAATVPAASVQTGDTPVNGDLVSIPTDVRYAVYDEERTRTNAQLVLQYAPSDAMEMTLDYIYSENEIEAERHEQSMWFAGVYTSIDWDRSAEGVHTPTQIIEEGLVGKDYAFSNQARHRISENESVGFNLKWNVSDNFNLTFDAHNSTAEAGPGAAWGNWANVSMGAPIGSRTEVNFGEIPELLVEFDDSINGADNNGVLSAGDIGSQVARAAAGWQEQDVTQIRIDGELVWDDGSFSFGIESREQEAANRNTGESTDVMGNWGITDVDAFPDELLSSRNIIGQFEDFDTGNTPTAAVIGNAIEIAEWGASEYFDSGNGGWLNGNEFTRLTTFATNQVTEESIFAAYFQFDLESELGGMPINILAGLRYEDTESTSNAIENVPTSITWTDNDDFVFNRSTDIQTSSSKNTYSHLLPNFDFDIGLKEDLKARFSYSKTIARPTFNNLDIAASNLSISAPTLTSPTNPATANRGNPNLVPTESDNFDLSLEWYFADSSYASIGYFEKRVTNFVGQGTFTDGLNGVTDVTAGPRIQQALADLQALDPNATITDSAIFAQAAITEFGLTGFDPFDPQDQTDIGSGGSDGQAWDLTGDTADPAYQFLYNGPVNANNAKIEGFEIAAQHFFGDTGFGMQANLTFVNSNTGFDRGADPSINQFVIQGLSDTRNLIFIYENFGLQARLAYNWRDQFYDRIIQANEPRFVEAFEQWDLSVGYDITDNLQVNFEGINLTGEDSRSHGRSELQLVNLEELGPRYALGVRYTF